MYHTTENINTLSKHSIPKLAKINILLSSYDYLFSDFDSSAYAERTLSDDFITQAKNISKNKPGTKILVTLLLPANRRNDEEEKVIIERLYSYFKTIHIQLIADARKIKTKGLVLTLVGTITMIAASYMSFIKPEKYSAHLLIVLFEPAGWFLLWMGLDHLVNTSKETQEELNFYSKMIKSEIKFSNSKSIYI